MRAIRVLLNDELLRAVDGQARRRGCSRSQFLREAVARYLAELRREELEERHRLGYQRSPQTAEEVEARERAQVWPES